MGSPNGPGERSEPGFSPPQADFFALESPKTLDLTFQLARLEKARHSRDTQRAEKHTATPDAGLCVGGGGYNGVVHHTATL